VVIWIWPKVVEFNHRHPCHDQSKSCLIKQAIGVEYIIGANQNNLQQACQRSLLCAGAIASPQILQRSGVGSKHLKIDGH
jgi:choline dehydrogenase-like flavoprotein